ncbi:MAG: endolytic transglycosylase MltG [Ruminococcaceae bacterium]|nr:endolytic transglycosylase MltG [Oscillospiraceae bacterium]
MDEKKNTMPSPEDLLMEEPPLAEEPIEAMPELTLDFDEELPLENNIETAEPPMEAEDPVMLQPEPIETAAEPALFTPDLIPDALDESASAPYPEESISDAADISPDTAELPVSEILAALDDQEESHKSMPTEGSDAASAPASAQEQEPHMGMRSRTPRKGRPKRKGGYGLLGLPHLAATVVWLAIILVIGTSLGRMIWVCAADVLAFGRESRQVSVTITSNDTIDDIAEKLHTAGLIRYPQVFKLYASIAVDEGDILPGTFQLDTIYDYHALVVQMGPRSSTRSVVEDLLIPEGLNCRQIFELLEQKNICTVKELEEYAANGEFSDFWFLEGLERGDKYCLEGYLFPDTYDFYEYSTPREALGKMLTGFDARVDQEETMTALAALNERLSGMMRAKGCSEEHIAEHQLDLRDLLTVASLIEEETASSKESPMIASVIFNRLTEDQIYERYLNIDAAIIYATGDANNIDTSIDHPYNTYKNAGLTPGPISNPGLNSINAALQFEDTPYYYYVLNPETEMHQFSKTLEEHEKWVEQFRQSSGGEEQ